MRTRFALMVVLSSCLAALSSHAQSAAGNGVRAGEFLVDPPTLINLGFEWFIEGDDNRNATVDVSYRRKGETAWRQAQPLLRLQRERIFNGAQLDVIAPNMFAGSILDLEPNVDGLFNRQVGRRHVDGRYDGASMARPGWIR